MKLTILELGTLEVALEAYIEDNVDVRMHCWDETTVTQEERDEMDVSIDEASALLAKVQQALKGG